MSSNSDQTMNSVVQELIAKVEALELRVVQLESTRKPLNAPPASKIADDKQNLVSEEVSDEQIESSIGQYGLAWLGNIVLFFGIVFLVEYLRVSGFTLISPAFGFASIASVFFLAKYLRDSNAYMAKIFDLNGYLLTFYVVLKLHFFAADPIISNKLIVLLLLLAIIGYMIYLSVQRKYAVYTGISLVFLAITSMLSDATHAMLFMTCLLSLISIVLLYKFGWIRLVFLAIVLTYFVNLLWMLGNPLLGHPVQVIDNHQFGYIYLFLVAAVFSSIALMPKKEESYTSTGIIGAIVFNGIGFIVMMGLFILSFFKDSYVLPTGIIAFYCICYSILLKVKSNWKITAALYAIFGYLALTATIYGIYHFPQAYFFLAMQSLLVVSMAVWFRSKFIVIMNILMYSSLLIIYLTTAEHGNAMNISFSFVALATARILNWQKERLTIRTEFIRNFYLITAFPMVLYTLYHMVPGQFITLSWVLAAVSYFLLSLLLKIVKYRYMALGTMVAAALFLFLVDLARIELAFRVIALLSLAVISLALSFYYSKKMKKRTK
jgi:hypothetical protein